MWKHILHIGDENMPNITLAVPEELQEKMRQHNDIRWSEVARKAIEKKVEDLEMLDKLTANSKLTTKDAREISEKINKDVAKRLKLL